MWKRFAIVVTYTQQNILKTETAELCLVVAIYRDRLLELKILWDKQPFYRTNYTKR